MTKKYAVTKPSKLSLIGIFVTILLIGFFYVSQRNKTANNKVSDKNYPVAIEISSTPTFVPTNNNRPTSTSRKFRWLNAYGVLISWEQYEKFMGDKIKERYSEPPSEYFEKSGGWYYLIGPGQETQTLIKRPYICSVDALWCGSLDYNNQEFVNEQKQDCLNDNVDYQKMNRIPASNHGVCCLGLITGKRFVLSCANFERKTDKATSEELIYTYTLLKESGADCKDYNCPAALETEITYY